MNGTAAGSRARSVAATKRCAWPMVMTSSAVRRIGPLISAASARAPNSMSRGSPVTAEPDRRL